MLGQGFQIIQPVFFLAIVAIDLPIQALQFLLLRTKYEDDHYVVYPTMHKYRRLPKHVAMLPPFADKHLKC